MMAAGRTTLMNRLVRIAGLTTALIFVPRLSPAQSPGAVSEKPLTLARAAVLALENDPSVRASRATAQAALVQYSLKLDEAGPKFALGLTPLSYDQRRGVSIDSDTFSAGPPYDIYADSRTLATGGGLTLQQLLPTSGSLGAGVQTVFKVVETDDGLEYRLVPSLNADLRQPLLADGRLLPTAAAAASLRSASLASDQAALDDLARRNQAVRAAVDLFGRVLVLRSTLETQSATLETAKNRAESALLRRRGGIVTEDAVLELELAAETLRAVREETRLALRDAERRLSGVLGLPEAPALSDRVPSLSPVAIPDPKKAPDAVRAALVLEKLEADAASRAVLDTPAFGLRLTLEPRYPDTRSHADELGSAISDYFGGGAGAGVDFNLSMSLDIPLSVRETRRLRSRADDLAAQAAAANRALAEQASLERIEALGERRAFLADRAEIQRRIAGLSKRKWERLRDLVAAGTALAEEAQAAKADWERAEADVLRTELDLLLAELDIRALGGEDIALALASGL